MGTRGFGLGHAFGAGLALLVLAGPRAGQAARTRTDPAPEVLWRDVRSKTPEAIDLVFLPDGFRADERKEYEERVRKALEALEREPKKTVEAALGRWNAHVGFLPSSGPCPATPGRPAGDTAFGTRVATEAQGGMFESDRAAIEAAARALSDSVDATIVLFRADERLHFATGDLPREGALIRLPEGLESVLLHELGHSLWSLGDEYTGRTGTLPEHEHGVVAFYPNLTRDPSGARFASMGVRKPKVVEGALYFQNGVWRSSEPCLMVEASAGRFCAPCLAVFEAGRPAGPPQKPVEASVEARSDGAFELRLAPAPRAEHVLRRTALLARLETPSDDAALDARLRAAEERVSRKTHYTESPWLGTGALPDEPLWSLEGHVETVALGTLAPGDWAVAVSQANLLASTPATVVRFTVPAAGAR